MSEFDFLSRLPIGQYVPTGSLLHRFDARVKIVIFTSLVLVITFTPSRIGLGIAIVSLLIGILLSKVKPGYVLKGLLPPLPFLVFIAIIPIVFYSPAVDTIPLFNIGRLNITLAGIWVGVLIFIRFSALILCLSLASLSISSPS